MKKNLNIVLGVIAAICFITVFYLLLTGVTATTAIPFTVVGVVCALLAARDTDEAIPVPQPVET
ncbi:MAG: hypothetical protein IJO69_05070 [Ruminiclostridium sp.]|nr:hypothetical protein [Ruminiclostridium sp.]MBQ9933187.1 hypothetical protein [Ruminiclostridium sp.]